MTFTKIELSFNKVKRLADLSDLAELLFPGNRNQQHAFLAVWISLKWSAHHIVPSLSRIADRHAISRRTLERVRAKMRRLGLIDHVSRLSARHGYREGWVLSSRLERALRELAEKVERLKDCTGASKEKDSVMFQLADARRYAAVSDVRASGRNDLHEGNEVMEDESDA